jgi:hypothetical protein
MHSNSTSLILAAMAGFSLQTKAEVPDTFLNRDGVAFTPRAIATAVRTSEAMTLDAQANEAVWQSAPVYVLDYVTWPAPTGTPFNGVISGVPKLDPSDLSASFQAAWDDSYLYILVKVTDDILINNTAPAGQYERDDSVEIYLSGDNNTDLGLAWNNPGYDFINDRQIKVRADEVTAPMGGLYDPTENGTIVIPQDVNTQRAFRETEDGYILEIRMDFSGIFRDFMGNGTTVQNAVAGTYFGFDVKVSDNDDGVNRKIAYGWAFPGNDSYASPGLFGTLVLVAGGTVEPPPVYTTIWADVTADENGWKESGIGFIHDAAYPYVFHASHGWLYIDGATASLASFYAYTLSSGDWAMSGDALAGFRYDYTAGAWVTW